MPDQTVRIPDHSVTGSGPVTVFLLHGAFGSKDYWETQIKALTDAGYRVVAWDAPGYGLSPLPDPFSVEGEAEALVALLRLTGGERNVVLGHSLGGMIAQRAYDFAPDLIDGLVLSATSAAFGRSDGEWQQRFIDDRVAPLEAGKTLPEFAPGMLRTMMAPGASGPDVDRVIGVVSRMRPETFRAAISAVTRYEGREVLPKISVPVLCVSGEHDLNAAPPAVMEKMAAKIAGAEYVMMPGVGHFAWAEDTAAFNALLLDFLDRRVRR